MYNICQQVRVQLITFPLLYGVCQLSMIFVFIGLFHLYRYWKGGAKAEDEEEAEVIRKKLDETMQDSKTPTTPTSPVTPLTPISRTSIPLPDHLGPVRIRHHLLVHISHINSFIN